MQELVSILIPVYNIEKYIGDCLESVINQTYKNIEIICVDDGSLDNSFSILQDYQRKDNRIKIFKLGHSGLPSVRNECLRQSSGEYVAFIDGDDKVSKYYIEKLMECVEMGATLAACNFISFSNEIEDYPLSGNKPFRIERLYRDKYNKSLVWGKIYKKENIEAFRGKNEDCQDAIVNAVTSERCKDSAFFIDETLYFYRLRNDSESKKYNYTKRLRNTIDYLSSLIIENKYQMPIVGAFVFKMVLRYRWEMIVQGNAEECKYANRLLRSAWKSIKGSKDIETKDKLIWYICYKSHFIYRKARIKKDPSLKKVEMEWKRSGK